MVKQRKLKLNNRGITTITLVVTIIILIILATITVVILLNSRLFDLTLWGKEKYEEEARKEADFIENIDNYLNLGESDDIILSDKFYAPEESTYKKMRKPCVLFTRYEWF